MMLQWFGLSQELVVGIEVRISGRISIIVLKLRNSNQILKNKIF